MQPNLVTSTYRITGLHFTYGSRALSAAYAGKTTFRITELKYTYGCPTLVEACVYYLYFQNQLVTLNLLVSSPKGSV